MQLTTRGLIFLLIAAPLIALTTALPVPEWVGWLWLPLALILLTTDWVMAGPVSQFETARIHDNRLNLGIENEINIEVSNRTLRPITLIARDEPPPLFKTEGNDHQTVIPPRGIWRSSYTVLPPRRGDFQFGRIHLRWIGPLGLVRRQAPTETRGTVKVYPNLMAVRKYDLLLRQNRLRELGLRSNRITGSGTEFEGLREYQQDDEFRHINWKATARRRKPITIKYQTERSQNIMAVIDVGRMMQSPVGPLSKLDYVLNTVLLLAYVSGGMGDRIGMLTFADRVENFVPPKAGKGQFYKMLELLYKVEPQGVEPAYRQALDFLSVKQRRRSLMILFTDFSSGYGMDELLTNAALMAKRHLVLIVTIRDPDVTLLSEKSLRTGEDLYEQMTAQRLLDKRQLALNRLTQFGIYTLDVPADELSISVIERYLQLKTKMKL